MDKSISCQKVTVIFTAFIGAIAVGLVGCIINAPTKNSAQTTPATVAEEAPSAPMIEYPAMYSSKACHARKYRRDIVLSAGGSFSAQDLISPCPPNARCVWSGIVNSKGRWSEDNTSVTLLRMGNEDPAGPLTDFPKVLTRVGNDLVDASNATSPCRYKYLP